ncbi:MAG: hypothetical protein ACRC0A_02905 [Chitinophagaceae bacterium]
MLTHLFLDNFTIVNVTDTVMQVDSSVVAHSQDFNLASILKMIIAIVATF